MFWVLTGIKDQYNLANKNIPLLEAAQLSDYPQKKESKNIGSGKILFIPLQIPDSKFLTKYEQKEGTFFGSSMVDVFADVPEAYTRDNINPELRAKLELVAEESVKLLGSKITKIEENNKFVEFSTMRKNDEHLLIHFVNYNVTVDGDITPAADIKTQIAIPKGLSIKNITYSGELGDMQKLKYENKKQDDANLAIFTFPKLNIYGLAKIELEED